jgi:predicted Rossmann-fold nucleotide-binding protein
MGILNAYGYYDSLLSFFDDAVTAGFISASLRATILEASTPENIIEQLAMHEKTRIV